MNKFIAIVALSVVSTVATANDTLSIKDKSVWAHTKGRGGDDIIAIYPQLKYNMSERNCNLMQELHDKTFGTNTICERVQISKLKLTIK